MRYLAIAGLLALACGHRTPAPANTPAPEAALVDETPAGASTVAEHEAVGDWNPDQPLDEQRLAALKVRTLYVAVETTAICPTPEQARARACGNSVEVTSMGTPVPRGTAVPVVGDAPVDGLWRTLRYQKAGVLPSWVRADDLSEQRSTAALDALDARSDFADATDAAGMSAEALAELPQGTLVKWQRTRTVRYGVSIDEIYVYTDNAAVMLPSLDVDDSYARRHVCMMEADCFELSYSDADEVSILARATGKQLDAPSDPDGLWQGPTRPMPLFEVVVLADRFGAFPQPAP